MSRPDVGTGSMTECVLNLSEGRRTTVVGELATAAAETVLDVHADADHNRCVLTLGGPLGVVEDAARRVAACAVARIDLRDHRGVHPRFGAVDVVPFVAPFDAWTVPPPGWVVATRDRFAAWAGRELGLPCFLYGPERSLPDVRRGAFAALRPDTGPDSPHPTAGACAVGARPVLVAYNIWISAAAPAPAGTEVLSLAREIADGLRGPGLRTLGIDTPRGAQVSFNVTGPDAPRLGDLYDAVAARSEASGCAVDRAELVGLVPADLLRREPRHRWAELDLEESRTIEARMEARGYPVGSGAS